MANSCKITGTVNNCTIQEITQIDILWFPYTTDISAWPQESFESAFSGSDKASILNPAPEFITTGITLTVSGNPWSPYSLYKTAFRFHRDLIVGLWAVGGEMDLIPPEVVDDDFSTGTSGKTKTLSGYSLVFDDPSAKLILHGTSAVPPNVEGPISDANGTSNGWGSSTDTISYTFLNYGVQNIYLTVKDKAGNAYTAAKATNMVAPLPAAPTVTIATAPTQLYVEWPEVADATSYLVCYSNSANLTKDFKDGSTPYPTVNDYSAGKVTVTDPYYRFENHAFLSNGTQKVYVAVYAINGTGYSTKSTVVNANPTSSTNTVVCGDPVIVINDKNPVTSQLIIDSFTSENAYYYLLRTSPGTPSPLDINWSTTKPTYYYPPEEGEMTLYGWAMTVLKNMCSNPAIVTGITMPPVE